MMMMMMLLFSGFSSALILGVTLDSHLSFDKHISSICKSAFYHIWRIRLATALAPVLHHIHSIVFLKPTVSTRLSVPPSGCLKCLRFSLTDLK